MTDIPPLPGTWWAYYTDQAGRRAVLTIAVAGRHLVLTTAAGAQLRLTATEAAMLLENLECATGQLR
ncbi:hypothetical protein [Goodfellowiella coeruleoviolacea]|uniref:Uncharacterized protein n=1 Tax=Goodfellowiella coeruleoviolacea TaxID=334858 RepID=A0AAE3GBY0_9PSEU|nr:hypothetical protein [Goodfellowiella coeruleoviolacea]MCP2164988.1 hypothetical protein [Goodfellowiella coeruleoviolacea]